MHGAWHALEHSLRLAGSAETIPIGRSLMKKFRDSTLDFDTGVFPPDTAERRNGEMSRNFHKCREFSIERIHNMNTNSKIVN